MLEQTTISPRESFLLGICCGEYATRREFGGELHFISIIKNRLLPFVVTFGPEQSTDIVSAADVSNDLAWEEVPGGGRMGCAKSCPNAVFQCFTTGDASSVGSTPDGGNTETIFRIQWNSAQRKSLLELLIRDLRPYMQIQLTDLWSVGDTHEPKQIALAFQRWWINSHTAESEQTGSTYTGKEVPETIKTTLRKLVAGAGDFVLFDAGRLFGQLIAEFESFSRQPFDETFDQAESYQHLWDRIRSPIAELKKLDVVRLNHYADLALDDILSCTNDKSISWDDPPDTIALRHLMNGWIAVGEILGFLRDVDESSKIKDASSITPRAFVAADATPDVIETQLQIAERLLSDRVGVEGTPEFAVSAMSRAIEALARRIWPEEFERKSGKESSIAAILKSAIERKQTPLHERFGHLAKTLYLTYRNPTVHEANEFHCSYDEARLFLAGIRALLDLCKRIEAG